MNGIFSFGALALRTLPNETFFKPSVCRISSYFGILMPAGRPEHPNDRTSRLVKSGLKNLSFSKSLDHGLGEGMVSSCLKKIVLLDVGL
jgi:hypothetical protein